MVCQNKNRLGEDNIRFDVKKTLTKTNEKLVYIFVDYIISIEEI
jgi:hypothetical protein